MGEIITIGKLVFGDTADWSNNLSFDSKDGEKSRRAMKKYSIQQ